MKKPLFGFFHTCEYKFKTAPLNFRTVDARIKKGEISTAKEYLSAILEIAEIGMSSGNKMEEILGMELKEWVEKREKRMNYPQHLMCIARDLKRLELILSLPPETVELEKNGLPKKKPKPKKYPDFRRITGNKTQKGL